MKTFRVQLHDPLLNLSPVNQSEVDVDQRLDDIPNGKITTNVHDQDGPSLPVSHSNSTSQEQDDRQLKQILDQIAEALTQIDQQREQNLAEMQQACIELSVAIASRLLRTKIDAGQMAVDQIVEELIAKLKERTPLSIRLNPLDLELLCSTVREEDRPWGDETKVHVLPDESIPRGNCQADCNEFSVLYDIDLQLRELQQKLIQGLHDAQAERRQPAQDDRNLRRFPDRRNTA